MSHHCTISYIMSTHINAPDEDFDRSEIVGERAAPPAGNAGSVFIKKYVALMTSASAHTCSARAR